MTEASKAASHDIAADISALRKDILQLSETVARLVTTQVDGAANQVKSSADAYMKMGTDQLSNAKGQIEAAATDIEKKIEHHPLAAMAIAAGLGLLIGISVLGKR